MGIDQAALVTITAPGVNEGLIWDRSICTHPTGERCSGTKGCKVLEAAATRWNATAAERLGKLHRAAYARVCRDLGRGPIKGAQVWEVQQRGVFHVHLVVDYQLGRSRARADAYIKAIKELAPRYMWGYADLQASFGERGGIRAASYIAKYVSKATSEVLSVNRPVYVGQHLTGETGITMRFCRMKRYAWWLIQQGFPVDDAEFVAHGLIDGQALGDIIDSPRFVPAGELNLPPPTHCYAA